MKLIYKGKTKDVYQSEDNKVILKFKDDLTGAAGVFDPGADTVGLTIDGAGKSGLRLSTYFFKKLTEQNIPTHFIDSNIHEATMTVKDVEMFGDGLEVICRFKAVGSFYRRYGAYCTEGQDLNALVEVTIKDDERGDPTISPETLEALNILNLKDYEILVKLTKKISKFIHDEFAKKGLELYDIKLEFGRDKETGEIILIDEISGGNMRVYKEGKSLHPIELVDIFLGK